MMNKRCLVCDTDFQCHISRVNTAKYCSRKCHSQAMAGQAAWNKGKTKGQYSKTTNVLGNMCLECGKPVSNKFCNHSCQAIYRNKQTAGKSYTELYGEHKAQEIQAKQSKAISETAKRTGFTKVGAMAIGNIRRGQTLDSLYGKNNATRIKDEIRSSLNSFRQTPEGVKVRQETSKRGVRLAISGKEFSNTKKGYYDGVYYGSSLELQFLVEIKKLLGSLVNVERNTCFVIPRGTGFCKTVPDYVIKSNGKAIALVECKSEHLMSRPLVYDKALALFNYGNNDNLSCGYFTYNTLKTFKKLLGNPEPIQLNSLVKIMEEALYDYIVNWTVQRVSVEDKETNKTLKNNCLASSVPNYPLPL